MTNLKKKDLVSFKKSIEEADNIYLASHISPDGDSLGSLLGLGHALKKLDKDINLVKVDDLPKSFAFLPGIGDIDNINDYSNIDLFISLDCADQYRLGDKGIKAYENAKKTVNIDHHISNTNYADLNLVDAKASSTCEIVYEILKLLGFELDKDIANCLYTGISTDTGSFKFSNTSAKTHRIAAELIDLGVDLDRISIELYQNNSIESTGVFIDTVSSISFYEDNKIAVAKVNKEILNKNNAGWEDTEDIISFIRNISGVELACLLKEYDEKEIKISLRSKNYLDVSYICKQFSGGGHIRAAGCTIEASIEEAESLILKEARKHIR